ncbi:hypothetical protein [Kribbella catacumbae]|uniref:hypothetical protein n=1 Tax=Kribbella catacumbae TaxID=460086 RepID=UPI0012FAAEF5|nr:hypothetical protein [Kribbella catacumbae]
MSSVVNTSCTSVPDPDPLTDNGPDAPFRVDRAGTVGELSVVGAIPTARHTRRPAGRLLAVPAPETP